MGLRPALAALFLFSTLGFAQSFEASVSGGESRFGSTANLGNSTDVPTDPQYNIHGGFQLAFRMTLNPYRFFGHEFGYAYNHSSLNIPPIAISNGLAGQSVSQPATETVSIHQGFYDFLAYATPEGSRIRPFLAGGGQFSSFVQPGASIYYGNQVTKWGFNYGAGLKVRLNAIWGIRLDARFYNMSKPFNLFDVNGRLLMQDYSVGVSVNL
jgi:outer membrane protein with beta-barrel domain